jgi:hypothetical protein
MAKLKQIVLAVCVMAAPGAMGFSLLGPYAPWQVTALTYNWTGVDIGGPMNIAEGFRWNVPVITYAFDSSFMKYFGPQGVKAVEEAMQILKDLPAASKISPDLAEYSTQTLREHYDAETLGLIDLKSVALHMMVEELGLTDPVRFTFTLRARETRALGGVTVTNYLTAFRNFDPIAPHASTRFVNGTLYTFDIQEYMLPFQHADTVEFLRFGNELENVPVATGSSRDTSGGPNNIADFGRFRTGLSRDDVGGLRYLYHPNNYAVETLLPNITLGSRVDSSWIPYINLTNATTVTNVVIGTNALGTNFISAGLRPGRNKLHFQRVFYDSLLGTTFTPVTNAYTDVLVSTNQQFVVQPLLRAITQPDIVFSAGDLGFVALGLSPVISTRTDTANWIDNDALNGADEVGAFARGPGVITPQIIISFTDQLPALVSSDNAFLGTPDTEDLSFNVGYWGSFDGSTNPPVIYSQAGLLSVQQLRAQILGGAPR